MRHWDCGVGRLVARLLFVGFFVLTPMAVQAGLMDSPELRTDPGPPRNFSKPGSQTHVVLLGSGNPLANPYRFGPATAIVVNGSTYLVDAGEGIWRAMGKAAGVHGGKIAAAFEPNKLTHLFVTHQHSDHTIGIPSLLMMPWYYGRTESVQIWGPPGIERMVDAIMQAWSLDVNERLRVQIPPELPNGYQAIAKDIDTATSEIVYQDDNVKVEAFHHHHVHLKNNYAYRFTTPDRVVVIGGDGTADDKLITAAQGADVFIAEIATEAELINAPWAGDSLAAKEKVMWAYHTKPRELAEIATKAGVGLLVLYHVQNYSNPFDDESVLREIQQFYKGRVILGRDSDLY